ncbi:phospholipid-transporting ATPase 1 [Flagelloscypha sp. PMI_526]|nr:phospholipid-transporting ATPase 1 [Flagelloscypha sp. PMI_526]
MASHRHQDGPDIDTDTEEEDQIDSHLRLRTVRTAASAIAESIRSERRQSLSAFKRRRSIFATGEGSRFFSRTKKGTKEELDAPPPRRDSKADESSATTTTGPAAKGEKGKSQRRNIYFNRPMPQRELKSNGDPEVRYPRNKVRTTKYTPLTFIPKNLYLQFLRVANLFFLSLVILQIFPVFGAPSGSISMIPLVFILTVTAIKDGIEDYRRGVQDDIVNNSAASKLGDGFRNPNQPKDPRTFIEKLFGLNKPGAVSKGVKKLRAKDAGHAGSVMTPSLAGGPSSVDLMSDSDHRQQLGLDDIQSVDSHGHTYPPSTLAASSVGSKAGLMTESSHTLVSQFPRNSSSSHFPTPQWERTLWKKLEVGDLVLLREDDQVPADLLVLGTSDPTGQCFLETKNLDGETNLKMRRACKLTFPLFGPSPGGGEGGYNRISFTLDSEGPSAALYEYRAVIRVTDVEGRAKDVTETVGINELLLRGCSLRNTGWVIGLVVFTGGDTKIMMNGGLTPSKRSRIEKETNFNVIVNFGILVFMCGFSAVMSGVWDWRDTRGSGSSKTYFEQGIDPTDSIVLNAVITFASCFIAFQNIVPISLYISIEIVKTIQAYFISQDLNLYYGPLDAPCVPKTWNISDDLGQIEYIFSDKTGTLTQNVMELQRVSVMGVSYGEGVTEAGKGNWFEKEVALAFQDFESNLASRKDTMISSLERSFKNRYMQADKVTLISPPLADCPLLRIPLPLCHGVLAAEDPSLPLILSVAALVSAARDMGFPFLGKSKSNSSPHDILEIQVCGGTEQYELLRVIEFDSTRKRMSVIVRCPDRRIEVYCKGADSVVYERLDPNVRGQREGEEGGVRERTKGDMEKFANEGLRTLCIAHRVISEDEFREWEREYEGVLASSLPEEERITAIDSCTSKMERDLSILGATALEDKLQEGVPEAIEQLHRAGIKLWILTGDKLQTAIEIGYSCNLLKQEMDLMILSAASPEQAELQIEGGLNKIASVLGPPRFGSNVQRGFVPGKEKASFAIVIDGDTLRYALDEKGGLKEMFLNLGTQCETVVCCRVSPAQKAQVVKLVKDGREAMTLSIGDGANDVAMIQEANIGCGLLGLEGSQAAMSADYAFGQFRYLTRLLLVHGHWSYQRVAEMHSNFFYKNVIWTFCMFWYLPFNSFDATYIYQYTFILLYNVVFTSLPVIMLGAFDQDINATAALAFPQLYLRGIRGLEYTRAKFWAYMFDGLYQSAVVFFIPYLVWTLGLAVMWDGRGIESISDFGTTVAVSAIFAANCYVGLNTNYWTFMTWIVVWGSSVVMLGWIAVYSFLPSADFVDEVVILYGELTFWTTVLFAVTLSLGPRFIIKFFSSAYFPLDKEIVREMWVMGDLKDELGIEHRNPKRNKKRTISQVESAPMFGSHARAGTNDSDPGTYEPANTSSPGFSRVRSTGLESPGMADQGQYITTPSRQSSDGYLSPTRGTGARSPRSPRELSNPSPSPSYYSVSAIPPPSPQPQALYKTSSGELTTTPPSRRTSYSRSVASTARTSHRPPPLSPSASYATGMPAPSEAIEMSGLRSPASYQSSMHHGERSASAASAASFATANDDFFDAEDEPMTPTHRHSHSRAHYDGEDDRSTLHGRDSATWEGGTAV